jgi:hypothetical protein
MASTQARDDPELDDAHYAGDVSVFTLIEEYEMVAG